MDRDEAIRLLEGGPEGIAEWNKRREAKEEIPSLHGANLREADLGGANLQGADLRNAALIGVDLRQADLGEADLGGANLQGADLRGANFGEAPIRMTVRGGVAIRGTVCGWHSLSFTVSFRGVDLREADLRGADLREVKFGWADLGGADLGGADLGGADLRDITGLTYGLRSVLRATFPYYTPPFVLSDNAIEGTRFPRYAQDPWSVLRRIYTGPRLAFMVLFTLLAFLPLAGRAAFLVTLSGLEQRSIVVAITALERATDLLRKVESPARDVSDFIARAEAVIAKLRVLVDRRNLTIPDDLLQDTSDLLSQGRQLLVAVERVGGLKVEARELRQAREWTEQGAQLVRLLAPSGTVQAQRRPVWYLLLGIDRGPWTAVLSAALLLYNVARALLTYSIGPLRDDEERTSITPAWSDYRLWWHLHQVSALLLVVASVSGLYQIATALTTPVLVPVFGAG